MRLGNHYRSACRHGLYGAEHWRHAAAAWLLLCSIDRAFLTFIYAIDMIV